MDHSGTEDPRLSEVKAVLQRLQRLSAESQSVGLRSADARLGRWASRTMLIAAGVAVVLAIAYAFPDLKRLAMSTRDGAAKTAGRPDKVAIKDVPDAPPVVQATALSHGAAADDTPTVVPGGEPSPRPAPLQPKAPAPDRPVASLPAAPPPAGPPVQQIDRTKTPAPRPALQAALGLMGSGGVNAARQQLLAMVADGSPDVAWALARSYDPNFLGTIQGADASPDIEEAARWYRTWYAAAVREGQVAADSVSLERIIGAMRQ
jgi:hypothetical protein